MELQFILPILAIVGVFILVQLITKKNLLNNNIFIRIRILLGCVFVGFLISEMSKATSVNSIIMKVLLAGMILYGVYRLQKKYFILINTK